MTTMTSREFNQDTARAKRAAAAAPVFITDRGRPSHVLMSFQDYARLTEARSLADLLHWPGAAEAELPLDRAADLPRPLDLG